MAGARQPIDLVKARGKKHLTEEEYETRKAQEVQVPFTEVEPPNYLKGKKRIDEFNYYADMLLKIGIFTELDVDVLAKYIISKELYIKYTKQLEKILSKNVLVDKWEQLSAICVREEDSEQLKDLLETLIRRQRGDDTTVIMNLQDKAFKQCLACAKELGLTISSRCKLIVPTPPETDEEL